MIQQALEILPTSAVRLRNPVVYILSSPLSVMGGENGLLSGPSPRESRTLQFAMGCVQFSAGNCFYPTRRNWEAKKTYTRTPSIWCIW